MLARAASGSDENAGEERPSSLQQSKDEQQAARVFAAYRRPWQREQRRYSRKNTSRI